MRELKIQCTLNSNMKEIADKTAVARGHLKQHKNLYTRRVYSWGPTLIRQSRFSYHVHSNCKNQQYICKDTEYIYIR